MPRITIDAARTFMERALGSIGLPELNAIQIAEAILDGELRGHPDHGLFFCRMIIGMHLKGVANVTPNVRVAKDSTLVTVVDGDKDCVVGMNVATDASIEKAKNHGMAAASVTNAGNLVALAPYLQRAADQDLIAFACSGLRLPMVAPTGGLTGTFGTNPMAYAAPAGRHFPFLLDMSTSAIAGAKVAEARSKGETLPAGLIESLEGQPMTDPTAGKSLILPMAGIRGYGLAMMVDMFANVMGDSEWGHFLWVLDPAQFQPLEDFKRLMDEEIDRIKGGKKKPGVEEIFYAGERGQKRMARLKETGTLPLGDSAWEAVLQMSEERGVSVPELVSDG